MLHVDFKENICRPVEFKKCSCRTVEIAMSHVIIFSGLMAHVAKALKTPCRHVDSRGLGPYH